MKKIGIIGGTFDPVHFGHLILAEQARCEAGLDHVVFIPARVQPFKLNTKSAEGFHRYNMLEKAVSGNPNFSVSDIELKSEDISYTINTLRECKKIYGQDTKLYFIIGTDAFLSLEKWYSAEELLKNYCFVIGTRPGYREKELEEIIERVRMLYKTEIIKINNSEVEISSTDIKDRIKNGKSIKYLMPPEVEQYIFENEIYS